MSYRVFTGLCVAGLFVCTAALLTAQESAAPAADSSARGHVIIMPDQMKWTAAPPGLPPGSQICVLDGDPSKPGPFTFRAKTPAGYVVPPHWHSQDEHIAVLSGKFSIGEGDKLDKSTATTLGPGGYAMMPAKMHHFAYTDEESTFEVHGIGPFDINYINPTDDPRTNR
jgi:hypothetical protein